MPRSILPPETIGAFLKGRLPRHRYRELPIVVFSLFFRFQKVKNKLALHLIAPESVTNVTKCDETFLIKTTLVTLVTLVTLFFKKKIIFQKWWKNPISHNFYLFLSDRALMVSVSQLYGQQAFGYHHCATQ